MSRAPRPRFTTLLAATATGVYLLIVAGATAALADAAAACPTWPACAGFALDDAALAVAWGHRAVAAAVGVAVLAATALAWLDGARRRVRAALGTALLVYPVQVGLGALVATRGAPDVLSAVHLLTGMGIFSAVVLALAWTLEAETAGDDAAARDRRGDPAEAGAGGAGDAPLSDPAPSAAPDADASSGAPGGRPGRPGGTDAGVVRRARATAVAYLRLTKPRLMWLLCLVAAAGMALAAGPDLSARTVARTLVGGVLAIGASGTFNHVLERDADGRMARTADRPLATRQVPVCNALAFGFVLAAAAIAVFLTVNLLAAALGLSAILFYSVVYTLVLKPHTVQNTVIGGAAGALPALIGWAAVTGRVGVPALALAGVVFLWTPAHFYNLALAYKNDYERGGFPMLPVVRGEAVTRKHVLLYLGATLLAAGALAALTDLGAVYAATAVTLGGAFLWTVVRLHRERTERAALRAFHASNAYLGALLLAIVVDALAL